MERCTHCKQSYRNHADFPPSHWPRFSPVAPCFSPGKFSPAATSAAQWLRRSWSSGTAPGSSGPWWGLRWDREQEMIQGKRWWGGMDADAFKEACFLPGLIWTCSKRLESGWLEIQVMCVSPSEHVLCLCVHLCPLCYHIRDYRDQSPLRRVVASVHSYHHSTGRGATISPHANTGRGSHADKRCIIIQ